MLDILEESGIDICDVYLEYLLSGRCILEITSPKLYGCFNCHVEASFPLRFPLLLRIQLYQKEEYLELSWSLFCLPSGIFQSFLELIDRSLLIHLQHEVPIVQLAVIVHFLAPLIRYERHESIIEKQSFPIVGIYGIERDVIFIWKFRWHGSGIKGYIASSFLS